MSCVLYFTKWDACPIDCGIGLVFLKAVETDRLFLFCTACGLAFSKLESIGYAFEDSRPEDLAPKGIALPNRSEIEAVGWGNAIDAERIESESEIDDLLWNLRAATCLATGAYQKAIDILTAVIDTWHGPPGQAYSLRAKAYRGQGQMELADDDERIANRLARKY